MYIHVLNILFSPSIMCAVLSSATIGSTNTFNCNGMEGQYINIVIPKAGAVLTLCEVEVAGQPFVTKGNLHPLLLPLEYDDRQSD